MPQRLFVAYSSPTYAEPPTELGRSVLMLLTLYRDELKDNLRIRVLLDSQCGDLTVHERHALEVSINSTVDSRFETSRDQLIAGQTPVFVLRKFLRQPLKVGSHQSDAVSLAEDDEVVFAGKMS
jgi:hypothetical protein